MYILSHLHRLASGITTFIFDAAVLFTVAIMMGAAIQGILKWLHSKF